MQFCLFTCIAFLFHRTFVIFWRLLFHPLARFPGPRLAAATSLYRAYHEIIRGGEFLNELHQMHTVYGTPIISPSSSLIYSLSGAVVRIGPNEVSQLFIDSGCCLQSRQLHFNDPRAYRDIYSLKHKYKKEPSFYRCFGVDQSTFGTVNPNEAKDRRSVLSPLFSRRSVMDAEDSIQEHVSLIWPSFILN